jgi:hypothetical protein
MEPEYCGFRIADLIIITIELCRLSSAICRLIPISPFLAFPAFLACLAEQRHALCALLFA